MSTQLFRNWAIKSWDEEIRQTTVTIITTANNTDTNNYSINNSKNSNKDELRSFFFSKAHCIRVLKPFRFSPNPSKSVPTFWSSWEITWSSRERRQAASGTSATWTRLVSRTWCLLAWSWTHQVRCSRFTPEAYTV